jgi:hypothetical protein
MLGVEGVTRGVSQHAKTNLPDRLTLLRERYETTTLLLPDFAAVYSDEVNALSIEKFPALAVVIPRTTGKLDNRNTDIDAAYEEYSYRYEVRLYSYVVGDSEGATSLAIKRYTLAVREAFLADKYLPTDDGQRAVIDPKTLVESYSELDRRERKFIAASYVQFEVVTHETLEAPARFGTTPAEIIVAPSITEHPYFNE